MGNKPQASVSARSARTGQFIEIQPKKSSSAASAMAGSVLTQKIGKTTAGSQRVIKDVSNEYSDALKRLADR